MHPEKWLLFGEIVVATDSGEKCGLRLAEAESELGLSITPEQLSELRSHIEPINFSKAAEYEKRCAMMFLLIFTRGQISVR